MRLLDRIAVLERVVQILSKCQLCRGFRRRTIPLPDPANANWMKLTEVRCDFCNGTGKVPGIEEVLRSVP